MSKRRRAVRATANFGRCLDRIESFLESADSPREFETLLRRLSEDIVPTLERFPDIGADFLGRAPLSAEGRALFAKVAALAGTEASIRQWVAGNYILLYAVRPEAIYLLAIRHHRELSFDFSGHWP